MFVYYTCKNNYNNYYDTSIHLVSLAVDWISDKLYWIGIDRIHHRLVSINVLDLTANVYKTIINNISYSNHHYYYILLHGYRNNMLHIVVDPFTRSVLILIL